MRQQPQQLVCAVEAGQPTADDGNAAGAAHLRRRRGSFCGDDLLSGRFCGGNLLSGWSRQHAFARGGTGGAGGHTAAGACQSRLAIGRCEGIEPWMNGPGFKEGDN